MAGVTPLDYLTRDFRISKTWLGAQMGLTPRGFDYAMKRGFRESEVKDLEKALHEAAKSLKKGPRMTEDFSNFCRNLGLNGTWLAEKLGFRDVTGFKYAIEKRGLKENEKDMFDYVLTNVANAFESFKIPKTLRQQS